MKIAIIGAGNVGKALGAAWRARGHEVTYGVRNPSDSKYAELSWAHVAKPAEAAAAAEVVVVATPWDATEAAVRGLGDLGGKVLIDCTNPLGMTADGLGLVVGHDTSGGEMVAGWTNAAVFKCFNTTGADNMAAASGYAVPPAMFVAGDDASRKPIVMALAQAVGFEAIDAGPLRAARLLEPMAMLWIDQAINRGAGRDFAFAVVRKAEARS
jgi:8-hydroxy-5-deazaflavin:NADPH oxidoreductase